MNGKHTLYTGLMAGALMLSLNGVGAQGVSTSNSAAGSTRVKQPVATPRAASRVAATPQNNSSTPNYNLFHGGNGISAYPSVVLNNGYGYGAYGLGGTVGSAAEAAYFGYGLAAFGGYPSGNAGSNIYAGNGISVVDSPLAGGFAVVNPNGAYFVGPNGQPSAPALINGGTIAPNEGQNGGIIPLPSRNANAQNGQNTASGAGSNTNTSAPISLQQLIVARQDANFNLRIGWLGNPAMIDAMNVTLLNQYHLPLVSNTASNGKPVTFAGNRNVYAARYYRVDIQFADGATTTMTGRIKR